MENIFNFFLLLGGIGLFLFGISFMSASLENLAGENLRTVLQKLTQSSGKAVFVGIAVTALIQSSGATMVMVSGFVSAQLMDLTQGLYVMLGAAIGTTITAQIIAFDIAPFAPLILFVGMVMYQFIKKRTVKKLGGVILGFGLLFMGIFIMGEAVDAMDLSTLMSNFLNNFSNPILALLFGTAFTFVIQSSSASVGILQVIMATAAASSFELSDVAYLIIGMNIGALAPLVLSSIGGNKAARRACFGQVMSRVVAALVFSVIMMLVPGLLDFVSEMSPSPSRQIANFHLFFNLISVIFMFPMTKPIASFVEKKIPDSEEEEFTAQKLIYVTDDLSKSPSVMLAQAKKETLRFAQLCYMNFERSLEGFFNMDLALTSGVLELEKTINYLNHELNVYYVKMNGFDLPAGDAEKLSAMYNVVTDLERIADHAENIAEYTQMMADRKASISEEAMSDLKRMAEKTMEIVRLAIEVYETDEPSLLIRANEIEDCVDDMQDELINNHIERLRKGICEPRGGIIYTDLVSELERCSDHAINVAGAILGVVGPIED